MNPDQIVKRKWVSKTSDCGIKT